MISEEDYKKLQTNGRSTELIQRQYEYLTGEKNIISEIRPATTGDGIFNLTEQEKEKALEAFYIHFNNRRWIKFVPASGAASRMFSPLHAFKEAIKKLDFNLSTYLQSKEGNSLRQLKKNLKNLPFFDLIQGKISGTGQTLIRNDERYFQNFVDLILSQFDNYPKGLIPFFIDEKNQEWTAFEAQLIEAIQLGQKKGMVPIHLTIDKNHRKLFDQVLAGFQEKMGIKDQISFDVQYSYQHRLTDTPFIDENKELLRDDKGEIAFRKGGHGSLLENINQLDADCIWIKNIDNILSGEANQVGELWMRILAGKILSIQEVIFKHLMALEQYKENTDLNPINELIQKNFDPEFKLEPENKLSHEALYDYLHRPIRICGMIPNSGSVGGGPFWKKELRGQSLQIIEGVELDTSVREHAKAISNSTHFNPVIMVCGITDHHGEKFSLYDFRDEKRSMISKKTNKNKSITILEWPGLWNGGMAEWNTIFIELPPETFNPVKSIMDLIR